MTEQERTNYQGWGQRVADESNSPGGVRPPLSPPEPSPMNLPQLPKIEYKMPEPPSYQSQGSSDSISSSYSGLQGRTRNSGPSIVEWYISEYGEYFLPALVTVIATIVVFLAMGLRQPPGEIMDKFLSAALFVSILNFAAVAGITYALKERVRIGCSICFLVLVVVINLGVGLHLWIASEGGTVVHEKISLFLKWPGIFCISLTMIICSLFLISARDEEEPLVKACRVAPFMINTVFLILGYFIWGFGILGLWALSTIGPIVTIAAIYFYAGVWWLNQHLKKDSC